MKKSSFLLGGALLLATLFTTSCKEVLGSLDNPVSSYVQIDTTTVTLILDDTPSITRTATTISTEAIFYESSDETVAVVDQQGKVTAKKIGKAVIVASVRANDYYQAGSASFKVNVTQAVTGINLSSTKETVPTGFTYKLVPEVLPADATDPTVTWETSDKAIATVEDGVVTAVKAGTATITAKAGKKTATCEVTVKDPYNLSNAMGTYIFQDGTILTGSTNYAIGIADGATVTLWNAQITNNQSYFGAIHCLGSATIILGDGTTNSAISTKYEKAGVYIGGEGTTLIIKGGTQGTGKLTATGGVYAAGIGNGASEISGNIEIQGGIIDATGNFSCGIGTNDDSNTVGNITISGGTVTATGNGSYAGIGSGGWNNHCGNITITGGTVIATGGAAAGIGTSNAQGGNPTCGDITISGGKVTAKCSGSYAAGIGSGIDYNETGKSVCGKISISGGTVVATKGTDAIYDIGPGDFVGNPGTYRGTVGTVSVTVAVVDENGDAATIYTPAAASAAARRAKSNVTLQVPEEHKK